MNITPKKPRYPILAKVYYGGSKPGNWIGIVVSCGIRREPAINVVDDDRYVRVYTLVDPNSVVWNAKVVDEGDLYKKIGRLTKEEALTHANSLIREAAMTPKQKAALHK
jgi:hypothetical protein